MLQILYLLLHFPSFFFYGHIMNAGDPAHGLESFRAAQVSIGMDTKECDDLSLEHNAHTFPYCCCDIHLHAQTL